MHKKIIFIMLLHIAITNKLYTQIIINGSIRNKEGITLSNVNVLISNLQNKKILGSRLKSKLTLWWKNK